MGTIVLVLAFVLIAAYQISKGPFLLFALVLFFAAAALSGLNLH